MTNEKQVMSVDQYISTFPQETQAILERVRLSIKKASPEATEVIRYGMPAFDLNGKHLVFFACWKHHISLYPIPAGDDAFQREISQYKRGKGTIQFPLDKTIPYDLIEKIVALLVNEIKANEPET